MGYGVSKKVVCGIDPSPSGVDRPSKYCSGHPSELLGDVGDAWKDKAFKVDKRGNITKVHLGKDIKALMRQEYARQRSEERPVVPERGLGAPRRRR